GTVAYVSPGSYAWTSRKVFGSFGSYDHPFCGSREMRIRISPSSSHSHMIACMIRPFTGNEASNSSPDLMGRVNDRPSAAATINPTTREVQGIPGPYAAEDTGEPPSRRNAWSTIT